MNTLSKNITRGFFRDESGYQQLQARWSEVVNATEPQALSCAHHLLYQAIRGKDWRRGFAPVTNAVKLANGGDCNWGLVHALRLIRSKWYRDQLVAPFGDLLTSESVEAVAALLPASAYSFETAYAVKELACAA